MVPSDVSGCSTEIKVQWSNSKLGKWWTEDGLFQASKCQCPLLTQEKGKIKLIVNIFDKGIPRVVVSYNSGFQSVISRPATSASLWNLPHPDFSTWSRVGPRICSFREFLSDIGYAGDSDAGVVSQGRHFGKHWNRITCVTLIWQQDRCLLGQKVGLSAST